MLKALSKCCLKQSNKVLTVLFFFLDFTHYFWEKLICLHPFPVKTPVKPFVIFSDSELEGLDQNATCTFLEEKIDSMGRMASLFLPNAYLKKRFLAALKLVVNNLIVCIHVSHYLYFTALDTILCENIMPSAWYSLVQSQNLCMMASNVTWNK